MDTTAQSTTVSRWIIGGMIVVAFSLIALGGLLLIGTDQNDNGNNVRAAAEIPTLDMSAMDDDIMAGAMPASTATPVSWLSMIPESENEMVMHALTHFGSAARGSDTPQVTIIEYGAYGCTSCRFAHNTRLIDQLFEKFPNQIRYVFIPWPVQHDNDYIATEAAMCALDQSVEAFWQMHNAIFDLTYDQYGRYDNYALYSALAEGVDLDIALFDTCMIEHDHHDYVIALVDAGFEVELNYTPTYFVNGRITTGYYLEQRVSEIINIK